MTAEAADRLPPAVANRVGTFPEHSMGAHLVRLILRGGRRIDGVRIAWGSEIIRDPGLPAFAAEEVIDAVDQSTSRDIGQR
jgi:hypothetical protein